MKGSNILMMNIQFHNRQQRFDAKSYRQLAQRVFDAATENLEALKQLEMPVSLCVTLAGPIVMRRINREQREVDALTDILSFPMLDFTEGELSAPITDADVEFQADGTKVLFLGELFLSPDKAIEQAAAYGHSLEREAGFLLLHGLLHLLGYDHQNRTQEKRMHELAESILEPLGLGR